MTTETQQASGRCRDCKYWGTLGVLGQSVIRECQNPKLRITNSIEDDEELPDDGALIESDGSTFLTMPNFGCVHFEQAIGIKKLLEWIREALADPEAPWYGSDLVPRTGDLIEAFIGAASILRGYSDAHDRDQPARNSRCRCIFCEKVRELLGE